MGASGVLALVDRRITQVQGAKVRVQGILQFALYILLLLLQIHETLIQLYMDNNALLPAITIIIHELLEV